MYKVSQCRTHSTYSRHRGWFVLVVLMQYVLNLSLSVQEVQASEESQAEGQSQVEQPSQGKEPSQGEGQNPVEQPLEQQGQVKEPSQGEGQNPVEQPLEQPSQGKEPSQGEGQSPVEPPSRPEEGQVVTHKPKVFERLWAAWPNKEEMQSAIKAWNERQVTDQEIERMRVVVPMWIRSEEWTKEGGKYVPLLSTWLKERSWEKDPPPPRWPGIAELSGLVMQPIYLVPRVAFALTGGLIGAITWPFDQKTAQKVWDVSFGAPWAWPEFVRGK